MPLVRTSPSGKVLFVCLVCGDVTPSPTSDCPRTDNPPDLDVRLIERFGSRWKSCAEVESLINSTIQRYLPEHLLLDWAENKLRSEIDRYCGTCHGYGCQVCLGKGGRR